MLRNVLRNVSTINCLPVIYQTRCKSVFNRKSAFELWRSVVPPVRKKRSGGKRIPKKAIKNLNIGRPIGSGPAALKYFGLNYHEGSADGTSIYSGAIDEESIKEIEKKRDEKDRTVKLRGRHVPHELRGWTSKSVGGMSVGPPEDANGIDLSKFETKILEVRRVCAMKYMGRRYRARVLVVTGNGNGTIGWGYAKADLINSALRLAKCKAANRLIYIQRYQQSTIYSDVDEVVDRTTVSLRRRPLGYGLKCMRIIRSICELAGIYDIYAKVNGPTNVLKIVTATCNALANQQTYQQMADEKKLHVVEMGPIPRVLASPSGGFVSTQPDDWKKAMDKTLFWREHNHHKEEMRIRTGKSSPFKRPGKLNPIIFSEKFRHAIND